MNKLRKIEQYFEQYDLEQLRVRIHDKDTVRIEVLPEDMEFILGNRYLITDKIKSFGFNYITLDLEGYRSGSMNEVL